MAGGTWKSFVRFVGFAVAVLVFALANVESKACDSSKREAAGDAEASANRPKKPRKFLWPARGRVIISLCGWHNEGIDLTVPDGAPVRASDAGVVAYAGDELKRYGNVIIIRHRDGFVSAYAYVVELKVKRGDDVSRGQIIATAGRGPNDQPLLHFELRKGTRPLDPMRYLEAKMAISPVLHR